MSESPRDIQGSKEAREKGHQSEGKAGQRAAEMIISTFYLFSPICVWGKRSYIFPHIPSVHTYINIFPGVSTGGMWKPQEDVEKTVTCLIQTQKLINQPAPQLQSAGFPCYLGSEKESNIPSLLFFQRCWNGNLKSLNDYFIVAWSNAFTVLLGPDRPLPPWYLLTKRSIFASLHPHFRWSKLPISPGRIPFLLKSPFWRLKPLFIWLNHQFSGWTIPFSWWTYQKKIHFSWLTKWTISISDG